jgi:hypothetical protein
MQAAELLWEPSFQTMVASSGTAGSGNLPCPPTGSGAGMVTSGSAVPNGLGHGSCGFVAGPLQALLFF